MYIDRMTSVDYKTITKNINKKSNENPHEISIKNPQTIPLFKLKSFNEEHSLGFDEQDISFYKTLFNKYGRSPTDVELYDLAQSNSEHSRHWFFNGDLFIRKKYDK